MIEVQKKRTRWSVKQWRWESGAVIKIIIIKKNDNDKENPIDGKKLGTTESSPLKQIQKKKSRWTKKSTKCEIGP